MKVEKNDFKTAVEQFANRIKTVAQIWSNLVNNKVAKKS